jgi:hypothetical protein
MIWCIHVIIIAIVGIVVEVVVVVVMVMMMIVIVIVIIIIDHTLNVLYILFSNTTVYNRYIAEHMRTAYVN